MLTVSAPELADVIRHVAVRNLQPIMIWGKPGIGKSQIVSQVAREHKATKENGALVDVRLSQYDSVDLRGVPVPDMERMVTVWNMPSTLPFKGNSAFAKIKGYIFLFLDELNSATSGVQAASYQLINDRCVGEHELMDNVVIIAAGNREGDRGVTTRMPTPIANRLTHFELQEDAEAVVLHFQSIDLPPVGIAFLSFRKELVSTFDPAKPDKAFATPRSWEKALKYFADDVMPEKTKQAAIAGAVGQGPALEFMGFVDIWHKVIPVSRILKDPKGTPLPSEQSMMYATAVNISGSIDDKTAKPLHQYLMRMEPTYAILAWHLAVKRDKKLYQTDEFLKLANEYKLVFSA